MSKIIPPSPRNGSEIAIIGMAGRFPGAQSLDAFWQNLCNGVESISFFSDEELRSSGVDPALFNDPNYVRARGILAGIDLFDASFFGFTPRQAQVTDPQHRLFLECAWEAAESAGYDLERYQGLIGVYAGASENSYWRSNICSNLAFAGSINDPQVLIGNSRDFLTTSSSYRLNLEGPSVVVQTACSTSLVAVHLACQSLLSGDCDMALAGGVSISIPQKSGYLHQEGDIFSPDGHCRAFDAQAQGAVGGSGVGLVVLKRLEEALADGDYVYAVIKGSAINNDGALKIGYTAPRIDGQSKVIRSAQLMAEVDPETITYVEAHGTGTPLGDSIEIAALTQAFRVSTPRKGFCAIGSVKTNIGHLDTTSGIAGLMKTVLALHHKMIPPSLHFKESDPQIDLKNSPFYVNVKLKEWETDAVPHRAGVSSFGIGGTNAHVVLEESPALQSSRPSRPWQLLLLSAKTDSALEMATANLAAHLKGHPDLSLADVAYTLQVGRSAFSHRRMLVCRDLAEAAAVLEMRDLQRVVTGVSEAQDRPVVFMFPGMGEQYLNMALELYQVEPTFRECVDRCAEFLKPLLGLDLREVLYPNGTSWRDVTVEAPAAVGSQIDLRKLLRRTEEQPDGLTRQLDQTCLAHPILFAIEYALAKLWIEWGIRPRAMIGHSIGEYVAACLAGVFSLEDALFLVAKRAQLIQNLPGGAMLAVLLSEDQVQPRLSDRLSLAAINAPFACVVSGPAEAVAELERQLLEEGIACQRVQTYHAFHSTMMTPIAGPFRELLKQVRFQPPTIPFMSNVTGRWITAAEATDPDYWVNHLRQTVRLADGLQLLLREREQILLEVGPGYTLSTLAIHHPERTEQVVLSSLLQPQNRQSAEPFLLTTLGNLWLAGARVDWPGLHTHEQRERVPLPTYPFQRERYWVESGPQPVDGNTPLSLRKKLNTADWFYVPYWKPSIARPRVTEPTAWLIFSDDSTLGTELAALLRAMGHTVNLVQTGTQFSRLNASTYTVNPQKTQDYADLLTTLAPTPRRMVYCVTGKFGFYGLVFLAQSLGQHNLPAHLDLITRHAYQVTGSENIDPYQALVLGPALVIPQEYPDLSCRNIDMPPSSSSRPAAHGYGNLIDELLAEAEEPLVAYRGAQRWVRAFETLPPRADAPTRLREGGVYWITGGLGRIGRTLADYLAKTFHAKLVLTGRTSWPPREEWAQWLATHEATDSTSDRIRFVQALEAQGAEVLVAAADVAEREHMQAVFRKIHQRFGTLHGVIHAAGIVGAEADVPLQDFTRHIGEIHFQPKVQGLEVLAELLHEQELDFCLLFSSMSTILGGLGLAAYAAANRFMESFAQRQNQTQPTPWTSVNWDAWQFVKTGQDSGWGAGLEKLAILPEEGVDAFPRLLSLGPFAQIVVSTGDLQARQALWTQRREPDVGVKARDVPAIGHARPNLQNAYVAPGNDTEARLAEIWEQVLGFRGIGVQDNFLELGGDSLLAMQLVSKVRKVFAIDVPLRPFFETPTIAGLGQAIIEKQLGTVTSAQDLALLVSKMENLSDVEVQRLLAEGQSLS